DDHTFTIELKAPVIYFKQRLGDPAYAPLPEVAFKDLKKYGEAPIGNGRYKLKDGKGIDPNKGVTVVKNENYRGTRAIKNGGIEVKFYVSDNAAYADAQAGNLDVLDKIPSKDLANLKTDFPDRSISKPNATFSSVAIPYYLEGFQGEEGKLRRRAISYAIDRQVIIKNVFNDTLKPAKDFTSSVLPGFNDKIKGSEVLAYDKKKAKELWEQANKIAPWPADRKFEIAFNADASHQPWVTAVSNDIKNSLGIEVGTKPIPLFADFLKQIKAKSIGSAFRTTWGPDFPSPASYLPQLYGNGGSGNQSQHNNPEFDKILDDAKKAKTAEDAVKTYEKAQELLFRDLPVVPLWNGSSNAVWSDKVSNVKFGFTGGAFYSDIVKKKK
ncbi:MAG: ABC transporter substrate-binding protein, partial [Microbacteriaceae bacterium]|nr:ABC transporter substrate-binding protein [Microbacteriaceae bacterium]